MNNTPRTSHGARPALIAVVASLVAIGAIVAVSNDDSPHRAVSSATTSTTAGAATSDSSRSTGPTIAPIDSVAPIVSLAPGPAAPGPAATTSEIAGTTSAPAATATTSTTAAAPLTISAATAPPATDIPAINAKAFAVYDITSGTWLAQSNADTPLPVGSIMKLLTTYLVLQAGDLNKVVTVPQLHVDISESAIGLRTGEQLPRDVLMRAMLIVSANDAAQTLALDIGGTVDNFVHEMNAAAEKLGLTNTVAANPIGLDQAGAHSSARDVITLAATLMQNDTFRAAVAKKQANLHGKTYVSTDKLLTTYPGANGVKTGHTTQAGFCVVSSATRNGRTVMVAVLGAPTEDLRFSGAKALLDWAFAHP